MEDSVRQSEAVQEVLEASTKNVAGSTLEDAGLRIPLERYTSTACRQLLRREPSTKEVQIWSAQLTSGVTRTTFAICLLNSPEARLDHIRELYRRFLGATPSAQDENFWMQTLGTQRSLEEVTAIFLSSPEVTTKFPSRAAWLQTIVRELQGTRPTTEEIEAWLGLLACDAATPAAVAMEIVTSDAVRTRQIQDWFRHYLSREVSEDQLHMYLQQLRVGHAAETVLAQLFSSHEYFLRAVNLVLK